MNKKHKTIGIILSAGYQTRFDSIIPKSLMMYDDNLNILQKNIETMSKFCDIIYVIINNKSIDDVYKSVIDEYNNVELVKINSGLGDGHAVYESLKQINKLSEFKRKDRVFLIWGDSIQDDENLFSSTLSEYNSSFTLPVKYEHEPYVQFIVDYGNVVKVKFKKFNDEITSGYHDYSLFLFNPNIMLNVLKLHDEKYWNENKKTYIHRNGELVFLDILNEHVDKLFPHVVIMDNIGKTSINAFNTISEYNKLINRG